MEIGGRGSSVRCRRREDRGAEGAERGRMWRGVSPPHLGEKPGEGVVPHPQKNFWFLSLKGEFWCILGATFAVELNGNWLGYWVACTDWWVLGGHEACLPPVRILGDMSPHSPAIAAPDIQRSKSSQLMNSQLNYTFLCGTHTLWIFSRSRSQKSDTMSQTGRFSLIHTFIC